MYRKVSFNLGRNENEDVIFGCDEIYNYMKPAPTQETRSKMECLLETCRYHHNRFGDSFYFFANDIKIVQYPSGYVVYVSY